MPTDLADDLTPRKRVRRAALLCLHCLRNLAYYKKGLPDLRTVAPRKSQSQFIVTANGNFLDICVMEWCKLFGSWSEEHHWRNVVDDPDEFKRNLLGHCSAADDKFADMRVRIPAMWATDSG